ncbi:unnamed protein product [Effrenium voratum]|nr:unnamed protein product [Effrenium voratum]
MRRDALATRLAPDALANAQAHALAKARRWSAALKIELGSGSAANAVMSSCAKSRQWTEAMAIMAELSATRAASRISFGSAISCAAKESHWRRALHLFDALQERNLQANVVIFGATIAACEGKWRHAVELLAAVRRDNLEANVIASGAALNACAKDAQWQQSVQMLTSIARSLQANVPVYTAAIGSCRDQWQEALALFREMGTQRLQPNAMACSTAIRCCKERWAVALELFYEMAQKELQRDLVVYNSALAALELSNQLDTVLALLRHLQAQRIADSASYTAAIACCGAQWEQALLLASTCLRPTTWVYNACLSSCEKAAQWPTALALLKDLQDLALTFDAFTCSSVVSCCARARQAAVALRLFAELRTAANAAACTAALGACEGQRWPMALQLLDEFRTSRQQGDVVLFNTVITTCSSSSRWTEALQIFADLPRQQLKPSRVTYGAVARALERGGQWQRALVFQQIAPRDGLVCGSAAIAAPAASLAPLLAELQSTALGASINDLLTLPAPKPPATCPEPFGSGIGRLQRAVAHVSASGAERRIKAVPRMREEFRMELEKALQPLREKLKNLEGGGHDMLSYEDSHNPPQMKKLDGDVVSPEPEEDAGDQTTHEDAMEPVPFLETTWNLVLVLGHSGVGWIDVIVAWLLLVASAGMQITFSWILTSESFLGEPFDQAQVETALSWRRSVAHDHTYLDFAKTSLTSRVCNGDGSLIISTEQADLIQRINSFLNLEDDELEATGFRPGILLAMLCILLWCLYICNEFRTIFLSLEAVAQIPRSARTKFQGARFEVISYGRFWAYCLLRLLRACIAGVLLYAGVLWLGSTTSITDLILNAVALEAILDLDTTIFSALMPKKLQLKVEDLEAIKVQYSRLRSQMESVCILVLLGALLAWPYFTIVGPLGDTMAAVKHAHCGGHQDFVVGFNEDQNMPFGFKSVPFNRSAEQTVVELAIGDYIFQDGLEAKYIAFHTDSQRFESYRTQTMTAAASEKTWCSDVDVFFQPDNPYASQAPYFRPFFRAAMLGLGLPSNSSCADAQHRCDDEDAQLLRLVCGRTCCINSRSNPWFKVPAKGCYVACLEEADRSGECTNQVDLPAWDQFWDLYPTVLETTLGQTLDSTDNSSAFDVYQIIDAMKTYGCAALAMNGNQNEVTTYRPWCGGNEELFAPLARLCPETCNCTDLTVLSVVPAWCPSSCQCVDRTISVIGIAASCADVLAIGWCGSDEFSKLCPKTCGRC